MGADKGKKLKVETEEEEDGADLIDIDLLQSVEKLQEIQEELEKVNEEASEKVLEVEQKYNEIRKPVYDERSEIIKSIPDFWLTAFMSHPFLGGLVTEEDQKIFKYLADIEVEECKDVKSGFAITFIFNSNPYFEDPKLTKTFSFLEEGTTKITATSIKWKEGMGIPNVTSNEKKKKKRSHDEESFFMWFTGSEHKGEIYDVRDQVAEIIKDELWSNPLTFFNNDGADEEDEMDDDDEEEMDSGESEDDDEVDVSDDL